MGGMATVQIPTLFCYTCRRGVLATNRLVAMNKTELARKIQALDGLSNDEKSALLELIRSHKKYGLVWEDKPEDIEERLREDLPVLIERNDDKVHSIISDTPDAPNHLIIEGDNLAALTELSYTHAGKIDVIYIDPPYNTGNKDFIYNDKYVDSDDEFRHSKWLCFMSKRLKIAKSLLTPNGLIFISIDDNEQSALRMLCDEIFGSNNFLNCVSIKAKASSGASGGGEDKKLKKNIEYLLIYSNNLSQADIVFPVSSTPLMEYIEEKREKGITWSYTNVMTKPGTKHYITTIKAGNGDDINIYEVSDFEIQSVSALAKKQNKSEKEIYTEYIDRIFTTENAQTSIRTRVADAVDGDGLYIAEYRPVSGRNKGKLIEVGFIGSTKRLVSYLKHTCQITPHGVFKLEKIGTLWSDLSWSSVSKEGAVPFPAGKKPIALIRRIIEMCPSDDCVILDFFAGSGSTAHAVMALNESDGGKRIAIIATSNENKICEDITYPRLVNAINGYGKVAGLADNNLRYYRTEFLPRERSVKNMRELVKASTGLLCIKNDLYTEAPFGVRKMNPKYARYFENAGRRMLVVYEERAIPFIADIIKTMPEGEKIKVYVFSHGCYAYDDEFADVADRVTLCALPQAIYDAYQKVLPKRKPKFLVDDLVEEIVENEQQETAGIWDFDNEKGGDEWNRYAISKKP